jgi:hypothetical protein
MTVDLAKTEGQRFDLLRATFEPGNPVPQIGKPVLLPGMHDSVPVQVCVENVLIMFPYGNESNARSGSCEFWGEECFVQPCWSPRQGAASGMRLTLPQCPMLKG